MKPTLSSDSFAQKLLFYGIGAGALSAAATGQATVVSAPVGQTGNFFYFTLQNTTASTTAPANSSYFDFTTNSNTKSDANVFNSSTAGAAASYSFATVSRQGPNGPGSKPGMPGLPSTANYVLKLGVGTTIGSQTFTTGYSVFNNYSAGNYAGKRNGDWKPGDQGFVGLRITDGSGNLHYGFADVTVNGIGGTYTLNGLAYETTAATPIMTFAIPEPGSTTALLVAGAAGAAALRARRRRA